MIALYIKDRPYDTGLALLQGLVGLCLFPMGGLDACLKADWLPVVSHSVHHRARKVVA
jgi:hypothetical protein